MHFLSSSLAGLSLWCRALHHGLGAGLGVERVFRIQAKKGPRELRDIAERIADRISRGDALEDALNEEGDRLPKLFRDLAGVGERTGHLPEIFRELAEYYELQWKLGKEFRSRIAWPVFQFFAAVGVIAFLIWVLSLIGEARGDDAVAPIGFGLRGGRGAIIFLLAVATVLGGFYAIYRLLTRGLSGQSAFESLLLRMPGVGPCSEAFAMGRFCLALRLTMETGMSTHEAVAQSLRATGNAAFASRADRAAAIIRGGDEVHAALRHCGIFPAEFIEIVMVAEISGQIPEVMLRQAEHYREEASRRLKDLTFYCSLAVWGFVAVLMILAIFRIAGVYVGAVNQAAG